MRFSPEGYYVERYVKCANCGLLIYDHGVHEAAGKGLFCSAWCVAWDEQRQAGAEHPVLKLPTG